MTFAAVSDSDSALKLLLPFDAPMIDEVTHQKNIRIGQILDSLSNQRLEWYGFSLAERRDLGLIVDTHIHEGQYSTGGDVHPRFGTATEVMKALELRNLREGRLNTERQLEMVGIVHRHGFELGMPRKSEKDIVTLSDFARMQASSLESLSQSLDIFRGIDTYSVQVKGDYMYLVGPSSDHLILRIPLGTLAESGFFAASGLNRESLKALGGIKNILEQCLRWIGKIEGFQYRYVSATSSIIYNQSGNQRFAELGLMAEGAVQCTFERTFPAVLKIVKSGRGVACTESELEREIAQKIDWPRPVKVFVPADLSVQPSLIIPPTVKKSGHKTYEDIILDFYHTACIYINNCTSLDAMHTLYLFEVLSLARKNMSLGEAIRKTGELFCDPLDTGTEFRRPYLEGIYQEEIMRGLHLGLSDASWKMQLEFMQNFRGDDLEYLSNVIREYVPRMLKENEPHIRKV